MEKTYEENGRLIETDVKDIDISVLCDGARSAYEQSSQCAYVDKYGRYYIGDNQKADLHPVGTLEDLNDSLDPDVVINEYSVGVKFKSFESTADAELCERVNAELAPCSRQQFFDRYCDLYSEKYGEDCEANSQDPQM